MMTRALACFGLILLVAGVPPAEPRASEAREAAALRAARAWLATVDGGRYDESLDAASGFFKTAITKAGPRTRVNEHLRLVRIVIP